MLLTRIALHGDNAHVTMGIAGRVVLYVRVPRSNLRLVVVLNGSSATKDRRQVEQGFNIKARTHSLRVVLNVTNVIIPDRLLKQKLHSTDIIVHHTALFAENVHLYVCADSMNNNK